MIDPPYVDPQRRFQPKRWAYRCAVLVAVLLTFAVVAWAAFVIFVYVMLLKGIPKLIVAEFRGGTIV